LADYPDITLRQAARPRQAPSWLTGLLVALVLLGAATLLAGVNGSAPLRAWQAYLVNLVFWTGLAAGSLLFSVILTVTHAHWGRSLKRLAEAPAAFLPVSMVLLAGLYPGRNLLFSWIAKPLPEKAAWLNADFLFVRDEIGLLLLTLTGAALLYLSLRRDQRHLAGAGDPANAQVDEDRAVVFANLYGILYFLVLSLLAFDLIMALDPTWYSTLFGAYYLVSAFYTALALLFVLALLAVRHLELGKFITPTHFHKLGKLLLGFCLMTGDFFYTQFLVMWYGNLPEETGYIIKRIRFEPWHTLSWVVLFAGFIIPFTLLLSSRIKRKFPAMLGLCGLIVVGMWLERFLLVAPSVWPGSELPIGPSELAITGGFLGLFGLCILTFLRIFPVLPVADPLFRHHLELTAQKEER
jgi:Ni/Fe-hydrogenase subunit HybB-like protein